MKRLVLLLPLSGLLTVSLIACGDDGTSNNNNHPGSCDGVQCGTHAHCDPSYGACACDDQFVGDPVLGCTPEVPCGTLTCSGHGTCEDASGIAACTCDTGYAGTACDTCATNYDLVDASCIDEQRVDCADITPPTSAHQVEDQVTITYTTAGGWTSPADCLWACDADFDLVSSACIDEQLVDCADITPPTNAHQVEDQVTITYTTAGGWTTAEDCAFACNTDYDLVGNACLNSQLVDCVDITPPANAHQVDGQVTITYTTANGWTTPADCAFACNTDYGLVGGACLNSQLVDCADISPPANAHQVEGQVTVTYTTANSWTTPADCAFACNTDYGLVGGACLNSQPMDCTDITPPSNAHQVEGQVTITYTTANGWTAPADCLWACDADYHREGDICIQNVDIVWCGTQWPSPSYTQGITQPETIYGQILSYTGVGTDPAGPLPGVMAQLCYSDTAPTYPTDLSAMTCLDATFNTDVGDNDEYQYTIAFDQPGTYYYLYTFSGDGGDTWTVCDTGGIEDDPVQPGVATITGCDVSGWTIRQANSTQNFVLPAGTILQRGDLLVLGRDSTQADFEAFWGVTLDATVLYINSGAKVPQINGDETFTLFDQSMTVIDGPTVAIAVGDSLQRTSDGPANLEANWARGDDTSATPGYTLLPLSGSGVLISGFSDAPGSYNFVYEFVELYCDDP